MKAIPVKTLRYLGGSAGSTPRAIVAGKYLNDGRLVLIDRKSSVLLVTNTGDETTQEIDLAGSLFPHNTGEEEKDNDYINPNIVNTAGYHRERIGDTTVDPGLTERENSGKNMPNYSTPGRVPMSIKKSRYKEEKIQPSDVNNGFDDGQLLITFTGKDFSFGVIYTTETKQNELVLKKTLTVKVMDRTRSIVVLGKDHFCCDTQCQIVILNKCGGTEATHPRRFRDTGGLLMSDGMARFFYGDGDQYVGCQWDDRNVTEIFRFWDPRIKFPRGSVIDGTGNIIVCCDASHNIIRISPDGKSEVIVFDRTKYFGDIDIHPSGDFFVTTFWKESELPILFKIKA